MTAEAIMVEENGYPYRAGDQVVREPQEVINARKQAYRRVGFEQRLCPAASLADLDLEMARRFLAATPLRDRPVEEQLAAYGLLQWDGPQARVTNAALLLFGKAPVVRWHPRAGIRLFRVAGSEKTHGERRNVTQLPRLDPPLATMLPDAKRYIAAQIRTSEKLHDLFFREMPEYPEAAWQEALVNAVAHRDYGEQGREIEVTFYTDRMEITNPGDLIAPVTVQALRERRKVHASRNPLLARVLVDAGIMREEGEGVPRIFEEMETSHLRAPEVNVEFSTFGVTLRNEPVFDGATVEWKTTVSGLGLTVNQQRMQLAYPEGFSNEDYRTINSVDRDQAYREISDMVARGVVRAPDAAGRGAFYRIANQPRKMRDWIGERLPRLAEYFKRAPQMRNQEYCACFVVDRFQAFRELQRLAALQIVVPQGQKRGRYYLPGEILSAMTKKVT